MGQPALAVGQGLGAGPKQGAHGLARQQGFQHRRVPAIGQAHPDAAGRGDAGGGQFGGHAAGAPAAAAGGGAAQAFQFGQAGHLGDRPGVGIAAGIAGIEGIHIGQQHQFIGADRHGHQGREGVVVAKAQFVGGQGVVFIHDGCHPPGQQLVQGAAGVLVAAPGGQVAPGEQHLGDAAAVAGKALVVEAHQPPLAHGGGGLEGLQLPGALLQAQGLAAEADGAAGDQGHRFAPLPQAAQAGGQVGNDCGGAAACLAPQQAGAHLDDPALSHGVKGG